MTIDYTHAKRQAAGRRIVLTADNPVTVIRVGEPLTPGQRDHLARCSAFPCESCQAYAGRSQS